MRLQSILTNTTDYAMDEERSEILAMAKAQLESLMEKCGSRPRADKEATATIASCTGGQYPFRPA